MELNMPGWIVSPRSLKSHMTAPQHSAAKMENCVASGGSGLPGAALVFEYGVFARARKEATTREQTYRTICEDEASVRMALVYRPEVRTCSFTAVRSPNTTYPPISPAMKVSKLRCFPPFTFF